MKTILLATIAISAIAGFLIYQQFVHKSPVHTEETNLYHDKLHSMASTINDKQSTWKAGHNTRWENMGIEAIKGQMGTKFGSSGIPLPQRNVTEEVQLFTVPDSFDSRDAWPDCASIKEVRDQANCGSCWAFGAVETMSDRICIYSNGTRQDRISAQDLLTCSGSLTGEGCNGGDPTAAWYYYNQTGISTGDVYGNNTWCKAYSLKNCDHHVSGKYSPCGDIVPTPECVKSCDSGSSYTTAYADDVAKHKASSFYGVSGSEFGIRVEIMSRGPVEASLEVYEDFLTYKSGVYQHTDGEDLGGHSIKMIGWGIEDGVPYWLCVNSWNEDWGENGLFKIKRGSDECGIESYIVAGEPLL